MHPRCGGGGIIPLRGLCVFPRFARCLGARFARGSRTSFSSHRIIYFISLRSIWRRGWIIPPSAGSAAFLASLDVLVRASRGSVELVLIPPDNLLHLAPLDLAEGVDYPASRALRLSSLRSLFGCALRAGQSNFVLIPPDNLLHLAPLDLAEGVGFEPTGPCGPAVFKTAAIDHSATPPRAECQQGCILP
jgi:hypothetical protein